MRPATLLLAAQLWAAGPVPVIFDTDIGNDIDDALALAMLHALESRGECKLLAVTLTNPADSVPRYTLLMNRFYGRESIPIGYSTAKRKEGAGRRYPDATLAALPALAGPGPAPEPAVKLLRRMLAKSSEKVAIVQVGFSDNLAALLDTAPDEHSQLNGRDLVKEKVALLSMMAGDFVSDRREYNVRVDVPAARKLINDWPSPVVLSGWEVGNALKFPATSIERDFAYADPHPVAVGYRAYQKMPYDRATWDLTSVLYAVRPEAGYFDLSAPGRVEVSDQGQTTFRFEAGGSRRYLIAPPERRSRILEALMLLASQPPGK